MFIRLRHLLCCNLICIKYINVHVHVHVYVYQIEALALPSFALSDLNSASCMSCLSSSVGRASHLECVMCGFESHLRCSSFSWEKAVSGFVLLCLSFFLSVLSIHVCTYTTIMTLCPPLYKCVSEFEVIVAIPSHGHPTIRTNDFWSSGTASA